MVSRGRFSNQQDELVERAEQPSTGIYHSPCTSLKSLHNGCGHSIPPPDARISVLHNHRSSPTMKGETVFV